MSIQESRRDLAIKHARTAASLIEGGDLDGAYHELTVALREIERLQRGDADE